MRRPWKRAGAIVVNWLLTPFAPALTRGRRSASLPVSPRVLLVRCDHIGDAVMATAVLQPLREALRPARLDVLAGPWAAPLFRDHPAVDDVIAYATPWWSAARGLARRQRLAAWARLPGVVRRLRAGRYDIAIDLRGDLRHILFFLALGGARERVSSDRSGGTALLTRCARHDSTRHQVEQNGAIAGLLGASADWRLDVPIPSHVSPAVDAEVERAAGPRGFLALALTGTEPNRAWPLAQAAEVAEAACRSLGLGTVYLGGAEDWVTGEELRRLVPVPIANLAGRATLPEALGVFARAAVAVTVDAGAMHLAAAAGANVVALFGPGDPQDARPWTARSRIVSVGAPCGCLHPQCDFTTGAGRCMVSITPAMVLDAIRGLLRAM